MSEKKKEKVKKTKKKRRKTRKKWSRVDGRKWDELRPIKIESGILPNADGSAYIEMGKNKIIAGVFGPREMHPKRLSKPNQAVLRCRYHMAPFSVDPRRSPAPSRRDTEISMVIREALEQALFLERYPRSVIDVYMEILEADGGTRCASINAAAVALVDAGIPMKDLIASCSAGKYNGKLVIDLGDHEDKEGESDIPVAFMPKREQVTLLQMDGILTPRETIECITNAISGCLQIYEIQKEALKKKYGIPEDAKLDESEEATEKVSEKVSEKEVEKDE
jgi:exosome complex component RRP41